MSKLDFAVIAALAAGCAFWIEQGHRIVIDAPTESELAAAPTVCPDSDSLPYTANCLAFLYGVNWPPKAAVASSLPAEVEVPPLGSPAPCPDSDNVPYSASCLAYLQGATTTGMRWRVTAPAMSAPIEAPAAVSLAASTNTAGTK